jgi:hypothetical protein
MPNPGFYQKPDGYSILSISSIDLEPCPEIPVTGERLKSIRNHKQKSRGFEARGIHLIRSILLIYVSLFAETCSSCLLHSTTDHNPGLIVHTLSQYADSHCDPSVQEHPIGLFVGGHGSVMHMLVLPVSQ